jgi:ubiquinone/menaquinone biosynthesis C-methylase UbiE
VSSIASWDEAAASYGAGTSPFHQFAEALARWLDLRGGERVVDLGCGNGLGLRELVASPVRAAIVGVDFSAEMLRACRDRAELGGVRLVRSDVEALPFAHGTFDAAIASSVFQFVGYSETALHEWARILVSGGRLAFSFPAVIDGGGRDVNVTLIREFVPRLGAEARERLAAALRVPSQPPDVPSLCHAAGFARVDIEQREFVTTVPSVEDWWSLQWTHGIRAFLREFDPDTLREMKARAFELLTPRIGAAGEVAGTQTFAFCRAYR